MTFILTAVSQLPTQETWKLSTDYTAGLMVYFASDLQFR